MQLAIHYSSQKHKFLETSDKIVSIVWFVRNSNLNYLVKLVTFLRISEYLRETYAKHPSRKKKEKKTMETTNEKGMGGLRNTPRSRFNARSSFFGPLDNLGSSSLFRRRNDVVGRRSTSLKQPGRGNTGKLPPFFHSSSSSSSSSSHRGTLARAHLARRRDEARKRARSRRAQSSPVSRVANPGHEQTF